MRTWYIQIRVYVFFFYILFLLILTLTFEGILAEKKKKQSPLPNWKATSESYIITVRRQTLQL